MFLRSSKHMSITNVAFKESVPIGINRRSAQHNVHKDWKWTHMGAGENLGEQKALSCRDGRCLNRTHNNIWGQNRAGHWFLLCLLIQNSVSAEGRASRGE